MPRSFDATAHKANIALLDTWARDCQADEDYTASVLFSLRNQFRSGIYGFFGREQCLSAAGVEAAASEDKDLPERTRALCLACSETLYNLASKLHEEK